MQSLNIQLVGSVLPQKNEANTPILSKDSNDYFGKLVSSESEKINSASERRQSKPEQKKDSVKNTGKTDKDAVLKNDAPAGTENLVVSENEIKMPETKFIDFFPENRNLQRAVQAGDELLPGSEYILLDTQQLSYLKSPEKISDPDDFEALIDNASDYASGIDEKVFLNNAQNLSVEEPEQFLSRVEVLQENTQAVAVNTIAPENLKQNLLKDGDYKNQEDAGKENDFFRYTVSAPGTDNKIITVVDERSLKDKLAAVEKSADFSKGNNSMEFSLNLNQAATQDILSSDSQTAASAGSNFQAMLSQQIQTNVPDFVKAGQLILKDNDQGVINLNLKPESLGNVKLTLTVSDKNITGQIIVHSKEAMDAFKQNLDTLKQAFLDQGFEDASFNLNLAQNQTGGSFQNAEENHVFQEFFSKKAYGDYGPAEDVQVNAGQAFYSEADDYRINVVA